MRLVAAMAEAGIRVSVKWAHRALVSLAEPHNEAPCHKIHGLGSNKDRITNHRCVNQEEHEAVAERAIALYNAAHPESWASDRTYGSPAEQWATDRSWRRGAVQQAIRHEQAGNPVYQYQFSPPDQHQVMDTASRRH